MALLTGNLQGPRQSNESKIDKIEEGEACPSIK